MKILIMGCGRVGARLALDLSKEGYEVTVIDNNVDSFTRLGSNFSGTQIKGNGIDTDDLRSAGIEGAQIFVAVTDNDNANIMAAQIAKETFKVPKIMVRIYDPIRAGAYQELGLWTICPTEIIAEMLKKEIKKRG